MSAEERLKNAPKLESRMFFAGLGAVPKEELHKHLKEGNEEFQLKHDKKFGKDSTRAILHFKNAKDDPNTYYFNSYDLLLKKEGQEETLQQNFRVGYGENYKLGEAYTMMTNGAVHKDFVRTDPDDRDNRLEYSAWAYIDFDNKDKYGNYLIVKDQDYDIEKKLSEYPIKEMRDEVSKEKVIAAAKKGEKVLVTIATSKGDKKMYVEANPKADVLNIYDEKMKKVSMKPIDSSAQSVEQNQTPKQDQNQDQNLSNGTVNNPTQDKSKDEQSQDQKNEQNQDPKLANGKVNSQTSEKKNKVGKKIEKPAKTENKTRSVRVR